MRDIAAHGSTICCDQSLGIEASHAFKNGGLRAPACAWPPAHVLSIGPILAWWRCSLADTLPFYQQEQYHDEDGAITALILLLL